MEIFISAVLAELASRSMGFLIAKYSQSRPPALPVEDSLQRVLLRAEVIAGEAAGRSITNHGMLQQLSMLRDAMYRGHYVLDTFRSQPLKEEDAESEDHQTVSHSSSTLSNKSWSSGHLFRLFSRSRQACNMELQEVLECLSTMIVDVSEVVVFLKSYPRLYRQPYDMHLLLGKCMFGRQMELQLVINFLLRTQPNGGDQGFDVLPIVGPGRVGKSTLVAYACKDERVVNHFSQIVLLRDGDLKWGKLEGIKDRYCAVRQQNCTMKENGRLLIVVDVVGNLDEETWKMVLCFASKQCASKVIITSRSDKIVKLGTVQALALEPLSHEAFWYFFKVITFGSANPDTHPRLAYLALEIARLLNASFSGANVVASLLRENINIHHWCRVFTFLREYVNKNISKFGEHLCDLMNGNKPLFLGRIGRTTEDFVIHDRYETTSHEHIPKITLQDVLQGSVKPQGKFEVLAWKSPIPPYLNYICIGDIRDVPSSRVAKRKRSSNNKATLC